jgi:hypothetical protein
VTYQPGRYDENLQLQRSNRAPLSIVCEIRQGQRPWKTAHLQNISETGFCIEWLPSLEPGRSLWIRIPGLQLLTAHIRWKRDGMMGCEFVSRLYGPVFEHIARQASAQA